MRVLVVTNLYPPHAFGGYEDLCRGAVAAWRAGGHEVEVLASTWRRPDVPRDAPTPDGERVTRTLPLYWDDHRIVRPGIVTRWRWERTARDAVEAVVRRFRPDVVSVWNAGGLPVGVFAYLDAHDVPAVLVVGDRWLEWGLRADPWAHAFTAGRIRGAAGAVSRSTRLSTRLDRLGDRVVATFASEHLRHGAVRRSPWPLPTTAVVPHGVDLDRYPLVRPTDRPWNGRLLYVGRVAAEKGIDTAVRALVLLPGVRLRVVGTGDRRYGRELASLTQGLAVDDRVEFLGEAGPAQLRQEYLAADALVFPSRWDEPFGIVPLEAQACGTPVIATATGGSGEFLLDRVTALTFSRGDHAELAAAIEALGNDPDLRARLCQGGTAVATWLSRSRTYDDLVRWMGHLAGEDVEAPGDRPLLPPALEPSPQ